MAATELIPNGTTAANSGDITVTGGAPVTVVLKANPGTGDTVEAKATIKLKDPAGGYSLVVGNLSTLDPVQVISGPGTYRVERPAGSGACSVFSA